MLKYSEKIPDSAFLVGLQPPLRMPLIYWLTFLLDRVLTAWLQQTVRIFAASSIRCVKTTAKVAPNVSVQQAASRYTLPINSLYSVFLDLRGLLDSWLVKSIGIDPLRFLAGCGKDKSKQKRSGMTRIVCDRRLRCSSTCLALIVGLLATERSLLPVRRSGTVCHTTLLTVCHWLHSAGNWTHFCFLYHFHDYILEVFTWATLKNFLCMYVRM